jgi:hypothetical protein
MRQTVSFLKIRLTAKAAVRSRSSRAGHPLPDCMSDLDGNGPADSRETDWTSFSDLGLRVLITRPRNGSNIP